MKKQLLKEAMVATVLVITITYLISILPFKADFPNPVEQNLEDFDIYDLCYSGNRDIPLRNDLNIYIIQASSTRDSLARQLQEIQKLNPAVIGFDVLCSEMDTTHVAGDINLAEEISAADIVPAYRLTIDKISNLLIAPSIFPKDSLAKNGGFVNFVGRKYSVVRSFQPYDQIPNRDLTSFAVKIVERFSPDDALYLKKRGNATEQINYSGNTSKFLNYSSAQFDHYFKSDFKVLRQKLQHKIVLLGFFTQGKLVLDDLQFSPLNANPEGRSFPDMYGVIIQANIIDMILERGYIRMRSMLFSYICAIVVCFPMLCLITWLNHKYKKPAPLLLRSIQVLVIILVLALFLQVFEWFHLKLPLTPMMVSLGLLVEIFGAYKYIAQFLHKKLGYRTLLKSVDK